MVFSGLTFLLLFLPALLLLYFLSRDLRWRNGVLVVFSLVFYAWGEPVMVLLLIGTTLFNYVVARRMDRAEAPGSKKLWLVLGVAGSLAGLLYFKYAGFFLATVSDLLGLSLTFDVPKYQEETHKYGQLSGRVIDEMLATTRELDGQDEKRFSGDFALWKKAAPEHIMRWPSPWSDGFPGWHAECTAMGAKYLGSPFDIHGGGMDLVFPHHESEIAQCVASTGHAPCRYWMHNNMITINGQKMGKSLGNFITLDEFFNGSHKDKDGKEMLEQPYSPMTIRFFILQAHYRSTVDFSNEALQAAEKGFSKLMEAYKALGRITPSGNATMAQVGDLRAKCYDAMNDDFATPTVISHLFEAAKIINSAADGKQKLSQADIDELKWVFDTFLFEVLGMKDEAASDNTALIDGLMHIILDIRANAKANKDWATSDKIRDALNAAGVTVKDGKDGATYSF